MSDSVSTPVAHDIHYIPTPLRVRAGRFAFNMLLAALVGLVGGSILSTCLFVR